MVARPHILLFEEIHPTALTWLRARAEVAFAAGLEEEALLPLVPAAHGIVIRAGGRISELLLTSAPHLQVVGRHGVGLDNVDVAACTRRGVWVVHTPLAAVQAVAEHAVALMLAVARRLVTLDRDVRAGEFAIARKRTVGQELAGRTLGIVGFGRIGQRVAEIGRAAFGMPVFFTDTLPWSAEAARLGAQRLPLHDLLASSDVVSLHVPLTPETRHLIGGPELARLRAGAILINTARGPVVDEAALIDALRGGRLAAGLDVFADEPLPPVHPLTALPNVLLTPHCASHTESALLAMGMVVEDVMRVLTGETPRYPANRPDPVVAP